MKKCFLFKWVWILGAVLLLITSVMPGLQYTYATDTGFNWEYINNETAWNASFANWWLKVYYEKYPSEDLWNTSTNSAPWFNDKIYTVQLYLNTGCVGDDYTIKQYKAQWYSDNGVQKIIDVDDNSIEYYIPTFFDTPQNSYELFCGASGGFVATPDDLVYPADKCIKVTSVSFWWENITHTWQAAITAPGAAYPWAIVNIPTTFRWIISFSYDWWDSVYPWWEDIQTFDNWYGYASLPKEFKNNSFLLPENASAASGAWIWTVGSSSAFDTTKFTISLVPAYTVTFVNWETITTGEVLSWESITAPEEPTKEWYAFWGWYLGNELFSFDTPITGNITLTAKWLSTAWTLTALPAEDGSYTYTISADGKTITYTNISEKDPGAASGDVTWNGDRPAGYIWFGSRYAHPEALTGWATFGGETVSDEDKANGYNDIWAWISASKVKELVDAWTFEKSWAIPASYNWIITETYNIVIDLHNIEIKDTDANNNTTLIKVENWTIKVLNWQTVNQWSSGGWSHSWWWSSSWWGWNPWTPADDSGTADTGTDNQTVDTSTIENPQAVQANGYTNEMNAAYEFAYANGITTMESIDDADMFEWLTRIAMAKMLSQYAINVLGKTPADVEVPNFVDVSADLDAEYGNGVTLAYKLWIMWINMPNNKFLPYDTVTRAQFGTALSRLLFGLKDWEDAYYSTHLAKLRQEWIISNDDPTLEELRGYVMLMIMRSAKGTNTVNNSTEWTTSNENENKTENVNNENVNEPVSESSEEQEVERYFTEAYRRWQIYGRIWDLQRLLQYLWFYNGDINNTFDNNTIDAVFDFQIAMWILAADDTSASRWSVWPKTREFLNKKWAEYKVTK